MCGCVCSARAGGNNDIQEVNFSLQSFVGDSNKHLAAPFVRPNAGFGAGVSAVRCRASIRAL